MNLTEEEREQEADYQRLMNYADAAQSKINNLDAGLRAEVREQRINGIKADAGKAIAPLRQAMAARSEKAAGTGRSLTPDALLRGARFHADPVVNATIQHSTYSRLSHTPTPDLLAHLEDAIANKNLAMIEAIRSTFNKRRVGGELRKEFGERLAKLEVADSTAALRMIDRIAGLDGLAAERFQALVTGRGDPVARMTAGRLLSAH